MSLHSISFNILFLAHLILFDIAFSCTTLFLLCFFMPYCGLFWLVLMSCTVCAALLEEPGTSHGHTYTVAVHMALKPLDFAIEKMLGWHINWSTSVWLFLTFLTVFARVSHSAHTVVVPSLVTPAEATVSTRLQYTWVLHLGVPKTSITYNTDSSCDNCSQCTWASNIMKSVQGCARHLHIWHWSPKKPSLHTHK